MTWSEHADGWNGRPEEILRALGTDGFQECKREMTTSGGIATRGRRLARGQSAHEIRRLSGLGGALGPCSRRWCSSRSTGRRWRTPEGSPMRMKSEAEARVLSHARRVVPHTPIRRIR